MIIKIFVVTKNEYDLIEDWTNFYGKIFEYKNLNIIDTGSTNQIVLNFYKSIKKLGVNIIIDEGYIGGQQGEKFTKYMLIEKQKKSCDFLLGCDTDNFLILPNTDTINKDDYIKYFSELPTNQNKFLIHQTYDSLIYENDGYENNKYKRPAIDCEYFKKSATVYINFYRCNNFIKTENGNHDGITNPNQKAYMTNLKIIHYMNTGIYRLQERSFEICMGYNHFKINYPFNYENSKQNYINIYNFIKNGINGCGIHRIIQSYSFILRYYILWLFKKYATEDYCNIETINTVLYSNKNIFIDNYDKDDLLINSYEKELEYAIRGNTDFLIYKCKNSPEEIENNFINFFLNKKKDNKMNDINIFKIYNNCEIFILDLSESNIIKFSVIKNFILNIVY